MNKAMPAVLTKRYSRAVAGDVTHRLGQRVIAVESIAGCAGCVFHPCPYSVTDMGCGNLIFVKNLKSAKIERIARSLMK